MARIFLRLTILLLLGVFSWPGTGEAAGTQRREPVSSSVLGLFELKAGSKLFDGEVLFKALDEWRTPSKTYSGSTELDYYLQKGNLAAYLQLHAVDAIYLPIPINFVFVGFSGNGNHGVMLDEEVLKRWFEHMDHIQEHTRVPLQREGSSADGLQQHHDHLPLVSAVHYNYTVHAIEAGQQVAKMFETAIKALARREDPASESGAPEEAMYQVDMEGMSQFVDSLIDFLQLSYSAYNILVLNPNRQNVPNHYGYRLGPSQQEFDLILQDEVKKKQFTSGNLEVIPQLLVVDEKTHPLFDMNKRPVKKFAWKNIQTHETMMWVARYEKLLESVNSLVNDLSNPQENAFRKVQQMLTGLEPWRSSALRKALKEGKEGGWAPDCLTDSWVGTHRWAMLDLTAGPFSWGPLAGGEGVRSNWSLPSVTKTFQHVKEHPPEKEDAELEKDLEELAEERFNFVEEDTAHEVDMLLAEIDVYELFAIRHCQDRRRKITICAELETRVEEMRAELERHRNIPDVEKADMVRTALDKLDAGSIFAPDKPGHNSHAHNVSRAWDAFLASLGSTLSAGMRQIVTPPTSDGAYHFYEKISFHIYLITQQTYYDRRRTPFEVAELREELALLALPTQRFMFSVHKLSLAEEPALAMAYTGAMRSAGVLSAQVRANGTVEVPVERMYLDSATLQHQLQMLTDTTFQRKRSAKNARAILEVPIFVFAVSGDPVFIDQDQVAKGLSDMVLGVQLEEARWDSPLHCNSQPIRQDLRKPVKALVAATMEHLAGLLPSHVAFSPSHGAPSEDWRWSVGGHPLSATCREGKLTAFQHDAVARSFILTALDESVAEVNAGIALLAKEPTHEETYRLFKAGREKALISGYNWVVELWMEIARLVEVLDFAEATKLLALLEERAQKFHETAREAVTALHPVRCTRRRRLHLGPVPLLSIASVAFSFLLCLVFRPRKVKPKIN
eukprot:TRINITY_DN19063_c0_g1_i1.p1 TRINITY_DN19063_c0_g1~~TRINITY_DN19063_c0_g1_i1.p1  ORF type:complete len:958 (+),score=258.02 TRINITY_DN19063_c0_g1_i1:129-3002(+)